MHVTKVEIYFLVLLIAHNVLTLYYLITPPLYFDSFEHLHT